MHGPACVIWADLAPVSLVQQCCDIVETLVATLYSPGGHSVTAGGFWPVNIPPSVADILHGAKLFGHTQARSILARATPRAPPPPADDGAACGVRWAMFELAASLGALAMAGAAEGSATANNSPPPPLYSCYG